MLNGRSYFKEMPECIRRDALTELSNYSEVDNGNGENSSHLLIGRNNFN